MPATVLDLEDTLVRSGHHFLSVGLPCWQKEIIQLHKLFRVVEGEKAGLKLNIQKRSWHLIPSLHGKQKGKKWKK